jgi:hypothetical protein
MDLREIGWEVWIGFDWIRIRCHDKCLNRLGDYVEK